MTGSLAVLAEQALERLGDHPALEFEGTWWTSGQLFDRAARLSTGFRELGVRRGDRVAVVMTNSPEVLLTYAALWRAGAVPTPVLSAVTAAELAHVLRDSEAVAAVVSPQTRPLAEEAGASRVLVAGETLAELEQCEPGPLVPREGDDLAALLYTGGTTGRAKGVMLSHRGLWLTGQARQQVVETSGATDVCLPLPLSHVFGLLNAVGRMHLSRPGFVALMPKFDAAGWLRLVERTRPQMSALVPSMLQLLLREPLEDADLSSLSYVTVGGAPLAVAVAEEFERRVPGVVVCDGYGCTEVTSTATMNPAAARRLGSVGLPLPGVELKTADDGEVCVRSPGVMTGYWRDPAATAEAVRDGWLHTGDVGHLDDDGYLYVVDRKKDLIIRGGFNVYPRDVEDVLLAHPAVAEAAVVGRPDPVLGEEVVAFVALRPGAAATPEELLAHGAERLGRHKHPREVRIVDRVPLTSVGKTDRKALRTQV